MIYAGRLHLIKGCQVYCFTFVLYLNEKNLLTNSVDPDQAPHYAASDLGLHCLHMCEYVPFTGVQVRKAK